MTSGTQLDDKRTFADLFAKHRDRLLGMVSRRIDPALARRIGPEEVVQEAFLRAREKWDWFDSHGRTVMTETSWLYKLSRDCLTEHWRKHSGPNRDLRREMPIPDESSMALFGGLIEDGTRPSQHLEREELRAQVRQVVNMLDTNDREILWMRHLDGLSFQEIADVAGITANAANVRHFRAVERFMKLWETIQSATDPRQPP